MLEFVFTLKSPHEDKTTTELEYFEKHPTYAESEKIVDNYNEMGLLVVAMHENKEE